jgi:hypothetical protein
MSTETENKWKSVATALFNELELRGKQLDALLNAKEHDDMTQALIVCPFGEPLHFHHDGCPACALAPGDHPLLAPFQSRERYQDLLRDEQTAHRRDIFHMIERNPDCGCHKCNPEAWWMVLCNTCGNKRCPHATDHENACTNSNEAGQKGSIFE